jgi:hypothetical protein
MRAANRSMSPKTNGYPQPAPSRRAKLDSGGAGAERE